MTDNTKYEVTQADIETAAVRWCGDKERETFPEDIDYFKHNWRALPGLRKYVEEAARHRLTSQPAQSDLKAAMGRSLPNGYSYRQLDVSLTAKTADDLTTIINALGGLSDQSTPTAPQPDRESVLQKVEQEYQWGNLTKVGVVNYLRRGGFNFNAAVRHAERIVPTMTDKLTQSAEAKDNLPIGCVVGTGSGTAMCSRGQPHFGGDCIYPKCEDLTHPTADKQTADSLENPSGFLPGVKKQKHEPAPINQRTLLDKRKAVNGILAELLAPVMPDTADRIEKGNVACTAILALLTHPTTDTQSDWTGGRAWPEMLDQVAEYFAEFEQERAGAGIYSQEEIAELAGEFATGLADHLASTDTQSVE